MVNVMAHRGASGLALENSMEAFVRAVEFGADYVELDVRKCYTGELVVIHDSKVDRVTNGKGRVRNMSLSEIKKLVLLNGEKVLTLDEALDYMKGRCKVNIEIKSLEVDYELADRMVGLLENSGMMQDAVVSSFNHKMLAYLKHSRPELETAALFVRKKTPGVYLRRMYYVGTFIRKTKRMGSSAMNLPHQFVTRRVVEHAASHGLKVNAWTVNGDKVVRRVLDAGVDGIITDHPQKFSKKAEMPLISS